MYGDRFDSVKHNTSNRFVIKFGVPTRIWTGDVWILIFFLSSPVWLYFGIRGWRQTLNDFRIPSRKKPHRTKRFLIQLNDSFAQTPLWRFLSYGFIILLGVAYPYLFLTSATHLVFDGKSLWTENILRQTIDQKLAYQQLSHFDFSDHVRAKGGMCYRCNLDFYNQSNKYVFGISFYSEAQALQMRDKLLHELHARGMHPR